MGYRVTAHYKGCIFLKSEYSQYIDEFLSMSLWVTGLQHITRVAHFSIKLKAICRLIFKAYLFGLQGYKGYSTLQGLHFIFLNQNKAIYRDEFLSTSLWVTGLQGLQHITMVAFF